MYFFLSRAFTRSILFVVFLAGMLATIVSTRAEVSADADGTLGSVPSTCPEGHRRFAPCVRERPNLDCGTLTVPVDYRDPHGATIGIAVIRAKATQPAQRIGVMVGNPGGPGFSGVDFILGGVHAPIFTRVNERFDIVGFDPRGAGRSEPVHCFVDPAGDPAEVDPGERAAFFDEPARGSPMPIEQNGSVVLSMSTNAARDMDTLRRALGETQISYVGLSAGAYLGAVYATTPSARAMLLDAGFPPEFGDNLVEFLSEEAAFELVFQRRSALRRGSRLPAARRRRR
jgi:pimeloyl-ACP methyl ester carboxylesterase